MDEIDIYLKIVFEKILLMKRIVLKEKWKAWTLFELATPISWNKCNMEKAIFFWYCLNTAVCKFNKFNIGKVNGIQKKFVKLHKIGEQIKSSLLLTLLE